MISNRSQAVIYCEVCRLPHRAQAQSCEACGHVLGQAPDWENFRKRVSAHRRKTVFASIVVSLIWSLSAWIFLFGGGTLRPIMAFFIFLSLFLVRDTFKSRALLYGFVPPPIAQVSTEADAAKGDVQISWYGPASFSPQSDDG